MELRTVLMVALGIPLLWLIGWGVLNIGKIGYHVLRTIWRTRSQRGRRIQHPEFGKLSFNGDVWRGHVQPAAETVEVTLAGTEAWPNAQLSDRFREVLRDLPGFQREALVFLRSREPQLSREELTLAALDFPSAKEPGIFGMAFKLRGTLENSWRVEFEAGQPRFLGRED